MLSGKNYLTGQLQSKQRLALMMPLQPDITESHCVWAGNSNQYRYVLRRTWDKTKPKIAFIGLNPSTANEQIDDNTVRKCITIARRDGFGELTMLNIYAYRSTDPAALKTHPKPTGDLNDKHIFTECEAASKIVVAWGSHVPDDRHQSLLKLLDDFTLWCFAKNKDGKPKHPLYVSNQAPLILYTP
jgi:hypothetical protein